MKFDQSVHVGDPSVDPEVQVIGQISRSPNYEKLFQFFLLCLTLTGNLVMDQHDVGDLGLDQRWYSESRVSKSHYMFSIVCIVYKKRQVGSHQRQVAFFYFAVPPTLQKSFKTDSRPVNLLSLAYLFHVSCTWI